ncbi:MAG: NAD(P)H-dependent oxidoreductase [Candidatus Thermoplasmatota archaeon]
MKFGIIYYSRTGNTKKAAELLKNKIQKNKHKADLVEIKHKKKPGFFRAGYAAIRQKEMAIKNKEFNLKDYDKILLGTPSWAGRPTPYIQTFLKKAKDIKDKKVGVFVTGSDKPEGNEKVAERVKDYLEENNIDTIEEKLVLQVKKESIMEGEKNIESFIRKIIED